MADYVFDAPVVDATEAKDRYMAEVTDMFGEELYNLRQTNWDESRVHMLVDSLELARRAWSDPLPVPDTTLPHCLAPRK